MMIDKIAPSAATSMTAMPAKGDMKAAPARSSDLGVGELGGRVDAASSDFGDVLTKMVNETVGIIQAGESAAISGIKGEASAQQVVEAVMSAEQTLQTAVVIRDKVVAAYLEISRMAI